MTAVLSGAVGAPLWTLRRARWFLLGLHLALVSVGPVFTVTGLEGDPGNPVVVVSSGVALGALQLRHSFAAARGERPRGWPWTLFALMVLVYLPMVWFTWDWAPMQYLAIASAAMLLRGWPAAVTVAAMLFGTTVAGVREAFVSALSPVQGTVMLAYWIVGLAIGAAALYGSVRLVQVADELHAARTELAELAIGRERLRVARDLHDLLGQSLSAISLKGDLAKRLLRSDASAARAEIEGLTQVAREALRDMRAVTRDEYAASLRTETDAAAALLATAGIGVSVDLDVQDVPGPVEGVLAWAVREGVTNMLRHSEAHTCSITAARRDGTVRLEIVNDGARPPTAGGSGLAGLGERVRALSGSVAAERTRDGRFKLLVEVPEGGT